MEELHELIKYLKDNGYAHLKINPDLLVGIIEYFASKQEPKQCNITDVGNLLKDKKEPTIKDAFIAGYKKRAEMSGLKYDDVSELNAITSFKCWKSFDL